MAHRSQFVAGMNAQSVVSSFPLSIAGRAGHKFTPPTMVQGFVCHARGVEIQQSSRTRVVARVRSKRVYDVDLRAVDGRLVVGCKCPARSFGLDVCKHAWAALLEVDRKGGLEALREEVGTLTVEAAPSDDAVASPSLLEGNDKPPSEKTPMKRKAKVADPKDEKPARPKTKNVVSKSTEAKAASVLDSSIPSKSAKSSETSTGKSKAAADAPRDKEAVDSKSVNVKKPAARPREDAKAAAKPAKKSKPAAKQNASKPAKRAKR